MRMYNSLHVIIAANCHMNSSLDTHRRDDDGVCRLRLLYIGVYALGPEAQEGVSSLHASEKPHGSVALNRLQEGYRAEVGAVV
jgi:hypothetical protein